MDRIPEGLRPANEQCLLLALADIVLHRARLLFGGKENMPDFSPKWVPTAGLCDSA